jgi:thiazole synthase
MRFKEDEMKEKGNGALVLAGCSFHSRLLLGSARYPDQETLAAAIKASGAEIITASMRRVGAVPSHLEGLFTYFKEYPVKLLPNTAGCFTAKEAVLTAQLAREALNTNWIKLEVIGDDKTLLPDVVELLKAAHELVREGFIVLPYCSDDLIVCCKLADMGCAAIMPLGSPIGSGMGILNPYNLEILREKISIPLILDAGIGTASDVATAMEMGFDAVLVNTAIAQAESPIVMAESMKHACLAGRMAFIAGRIPRRFYASASSPCEGVMQ